MISGFSWEIIRSGDRGGSNGDWPVCKSHGLPIHQVCSKSAPRLPVPSSAWLAVNWGRRPLLWPSWHRTQGFWLPGPRLAAGFWLTSHCVCARWPEMPWGLPTEPVRVVQECERALFSAQPHACGLSSPWPSASFPQSLQLKTYYLPTPPGAALGRSFIL